MISFPSFELRFHPNETDFPISNVTEKEEHICYKTTGHVKYQNETYFAQTFAFVYLENKAIGCGYQCFPRSHALGYHHGDVEKVTLLYELSSTEPKKIEKSTPSLVYFNAHSRGQGTMRTFEECEKTEDGGLVVYIARNSHASYPRKGRYWRVFGFANDVCSDRGKRIRITKFINTTDEYTTETGILFRPVVVTPPSKSITKWERFCLAFYVKKLRRAQ